MEKGAIFRHPQPTTMSKKLSVKAQQKLAALEEAKRKLDRVYSLIEKYAATGLDHLAGSVKRTGAEVGRLFMNNGFGVMADHARQLGMTAARGGATQAKFRMMREALASLRGEMERAEKSVMTADRSDPED